MGKKVGKDATVVYSWLKKLGQSAGGLSKEGWPAWPGE